MGLKDGRRRREGMVIETIIDIEPEALARLGPHISCSCYL